MKERGTACSLLAALLVEADPKDGLAARLSGLAISGVAIEQMIGVSAHGRSPARGRECGEVTTSRRL